MNIKQAVARILNIEAGEGRLLFLILIQAFLQNVSLNFLYSAAFALFLTEFSAQTLPILYLVNAVLVSLIAFAYLKIGERISFSNLLWLNFCFQVLVVGGFYLGLLFNRAAWLVFALAVVYEVMANIGSLSTWSLAGRVFNVRQGKRVFGTIGISEWGGTIATGFVISLIILWLGIENVILLAALTGGGMLVVMFYLQRQFSHLLNTEEVTTTQSAPAAASMLDLLKQRYVLLIIGLVFLWYLAFYFLDNIFFAYSSLQYPDEDALAGFFGIFWSIVGIIAVLGNFFAGRVLNQQGIRSVLRYLPILLILLGGVGLALSIIDVQVIILFAVVTLMRLAMSGLGMSIDKRAQDILYQPLPINERGRILTVAEGIIRPGANGAAGAVLLLLGFLFADNLNILMIGFLLIVGLWLAVAFMFGQDYPKAVAQALHKRFFGQDQALDLKDRRIIKELQAGLESSHPEIVIYSLDLLTQADPELVQTKLLDLLSYPVSEVRQEVLERLIQLGTVNDLEPIRSVILTDQDVNVRAKAVDALATLGQTAVFSDLVSYLDDQESPVQVQAMSGLIRHGGLEGMLLAGQRLLQAIDSPVAADRVFAAEVLGQVGITTFYQPLLKLLNDSKLEVQQAALRASGQVVSKDVWAVLLAQLDHPANRMLAVQALTQQGEAVVPHLADYLADQKKSIDSRSATTQILARIGTAVAIDSLSDHLNDVQPHVRSQVLAALRRCNYQASDTSQQDVVKQQIRAEVADATWILALSIEPDTPEVDPQIVGIFNEALAEQIDQIVGHLFTLLTFLFEPALIQQAQLNHQLPSAEKRAYALETIDIAVKDVELKRTFLPLIKDAELAQKRADLQRLFPQPSYTMVTSVQTILTTTDTPLTDWIKACAIELVGLYKLTDLVSELDPYRASSIPLLQKAVVYSEHRLATPMSSPNSENGDTPMLSIIEKVLILKTVDIFTNTPSSILASMAELLVEVNVTENETIFEMGDVGDSLYIVVTGKVKVHNEGVLLNYLEPGQVFGEMALLDAEARSASVTAVESSLLLKLDQAPFYELMADHHDISRGIIQVLSRHLRNRVHDLNEARHRIRELEGEQA